MTDCCERYGLVTMVTAWLLWMLGAGYPRRELSTPQNGGVKWWIAIVDCQMVENWS